jgi:hypothetical protein
MLSSLRDPHGRSVEVVTSTARRLAVASASLGGLFSLLIPASIGRPDAPQRYDLETGKWRATDAITREGAYRYQENGVTYFYRDRGGRALRGPHELVKLLHARSNNVMMHSYDSTTGVFSSRLGCEPVGLLGRALVASSGALPSIASGRSTVAAVPAEVAAKVLEIMYLGDLPQ